MSRPPIEIEIKHALIIHQQYLKKEYWNNTHILSFRNEWERREFTLNHPDYKYKLNRCDIMEVPKLDKPFFFPDNSANPIITMTVYYSTITNTKQKERVKAITNTKG